MLTMLCSIDRMLSETLKYYSKCDRGTVTWNVFTWLVQSPADVQFLKSGDVYSAAVPRQASMVPTTVCHSPSCNPPNLQLYSLSACC